MAMVRLFVLLYHCVGEVAQIIRHGHGKIICATLPLCVGEVAQIIRHGHGKIICATLPLCR